MSITTENYLTVEKENQQRILEKWYSVLDQDYGEHGPDDSCKICWEAIQLGAREEPQPASIPDPVMEEK